MENVSNSVNVSSSSNRRNILINFLISLLVAAAFNLTYTACSGGYQANLTKATGDAEVTVEFSINRFIIPVSIKTESRVVELGGEFKVCSVVALSVSGITTIGTATDDEVCVSEFGRIKAIDLTPPEQQGTKINQ